MRGCCVIEFFMFEVSLRARKHARKRASRIRGYYVVSIVPVLACPSGFVRRVLNNDVLLSSLASRMQGMYFGMILTFPLLASIFISEIFFLLWF